MLNKNAFALVLLSVLLDNEALYKSSIPDIFFIAKLDWIVKFKLTLQTVDSDPYIFK